ncbi:MAG: hypothetical protein ACJAYU_005447, partial [Bradymonadia bacterium]
MGLQHRLENYRERTRLRDRTSAQSLSRYQARRSPFELHVPRLKTEHQGVGRRTATRDDERIGKLV